MGNGRILTQRAQGENAKGKSGLRRVETDRKGEPPFAMLRAGEEGARRCAQMEEGGNHEIPERYEAE